jgi:hypothetical protein
MFVPLRRMRRRPRQPKQRPAKDKASPVPVRVAVEAGEVVALVMAAAAMVAEDRTQARPKVRTAVSRNLARAVAPVAVDPTVRSKRFSVAVDQISMRRLSIVVVVASAMVAR